MDRRRGVSRQCRHRPDARQRRGIPRPAHGRPRLAVSAGRRAPGRAGRRGRCIASCTKRSGSNASTSSCVGFDRRLDALPAAEALRAPRSRPDLHRTEAALVPAAARGARKHVWTSASTHTNEPEFDGWRWANYWEPVREVIYFKRPVYVAMLTELALAAFPAGAPPLPDWWQAELAAPAEAVRLSRCRDCLPRLVVTHARAGASHASRSSLLAAGHRGGSTACSNSAATTPDYDSVARASSERAELQDVIDAQREHHLASCAPRWRSWNRPP